MGYSMRDVGAAFDLNTAVYGTQTGRAKDPLNFGEVLRGTASEENGEPAGADNGVFAVSGFSAGSAAEMLGTMSQIKEASVFDEFGEMEDLDSAISFDEIAELDEMTEIAAAQNNVPSDNGLFLDPGIFSEDFIPEDDDMLMLSELEDAI